MLSKAWGFTSNRWALPWLHHGRANPHVDCCCVLLFTGPALCVTIKGISSLSGDQLCHLLTLVGSNSGEPAPLQGLTGAWAVTDVLQVRFKGQLFVSVLWSTGIALNTGRCVNNLVVSTASTLVAVIITVVQTWQSGACCSTCLLLRSQLCMFEAPRQSNA
jgi:hypothetical protein